MQPSELIDMFAENVRERRKALGMSQAQLAEKLGAHPPYVSDLERGKKTPFLGNLAKLADALETTPDALIAPFRKKSARAS